MCLPSIWLWRKWKELGGQRQYESLPPYEEQASQPLVFPSPYSVFDMIARRSDPRDYSCADDRFKSVWQANPDLSRVFIRLLQDPTGGDRSDIAWQANLSILVKDLPSLMAEGIYLSEANLERCAGRVGYDKDAIRRFDHGFGWTCYRQYLFVDRVSGREWTALLTVFARDIAELSNFRIGMLSAEHVERAYAEDPAGNTIYQFDIKSKGQIGVNAFYDDMPMGGLWPWPKAKY